MSSSIGDSSSYFAKLEFSTPLENSIVLTPSIQNRVEVFNKDQRAFKGALTSSSSRLVIQATKHLSST
ncbi:hypothetical protein B296_00044533 [Ensete ventricosum]|uniref:Uncharacterized protein n=1 Tax=Ensete ventricosum TaxID=4639 RepID=A0A426XG27_ENSVE|nr:hypothetical protein B296_00044533 [Ensete ventricosum]